MAQNATISRVDDATWGTASNPGVQWSAPHSTGGHQAATLDGPPPVPRLPAGWMLESRAGTHLLLHPNRPVWCAVNDTGLEIARLADGRRSREAISSEIAARNGLSPAALRAPVTRFFDRLQRSGLLSQADQPESGALCRPGARIERLSLHITGACNLGCGHCAVMPSYARQGQLGLPALLDVVDQFVAQGGTRLALTGGEPLMRAELPQLLEHAARRLRVSVSTNGSLISAEMALLLAGTNTAVELSIDGSRAEIHDRLRGAGAFDAALRGLDHLRRAGMESRVAFATAITKLNVRDLERIVSLAERLGVGSVHFAPVQRMGRAQESWHQLAPTPRQLCRAHRSLHFNSKPRKVEISGGLLGFVLRFAAEERWCALGKTLAMDPAGNVYPCSLFQHPDYQLGNTAEMTLEEVARSPRFVDTCRSAATRRSAVESCRWCSWRNFCQAGCPASVYWQKGAIWETDDLCEERRDLYRDLLFGVGEGRANACLPRE